MLHNTKGIVLRVTKYGDTSIIMSAYTELFGLQQYIIKGARVTSKKGANKGVFYQPAAILQMEVYHTPMKAMQMVKEVSWIMYIKPCIPMYSEMQLPCIL